MNLLQPMFRMSRRLARCRRADGRGGNARSWLASRPAVESLERRLVPAQIFVVPASQMADATHLHTLQQAVVAAGTGGAVTIEPGGAPDLGPVRVTQDSILIQGEPNVPASILPSYEIDAQASGVRLTSLNLSSLTLGSETFLSERNEISKCLIKGVTAYDSKSRFSQNTFVGVVAVFGFGPATGPRLGGDVFARNTFSVVADPHQSFLFSQLYVEAPGVFVTENSFYTDNIAIRASNAAVFENNPVTIANNTIISPNRNQGDGISVAQRGNGVCDVRILNNRVDGCSLGLSMEVDIGTNDHFRVLVQGNDFHNNAVGVDVFGDGAACGIIDLGGGPLGSLGGNNFRGFSSPATLFDNAAIELRNATNGSITAQQNIFSNDVTPSFVVLAETGLINAAGPLGAARAFVQTLYNEVLGRTGTLAELDPWVNVLGTQGQSAVANAIRLSPEALGRVVDQLYIRFLGRASDPTGRSGWIGFLRSGGTLEQVETLFLTSPEYLSHINTDFVQSLYLNILGRAGSSAELALWDNNIQNVVGLAGVANAFVHSPENRLNSLRTDFQTFLHRTPSNNELAPLANSSLDLLGLQGLVLSSPEFFANG